MVAPPLSRPILARQKDTFHHTASNGPCILPAFHGCHLKSAAVDMTFVQFYPTLLQIAKKKNTLSPGYAKEAALEEKAH
jgi:hypothetical protein